MTPERFNRITSVLRRRQPDLTVITDEVHKQRNLAAIIRTSDAVGIDTMHCITPSEGYQLYSGTSASAEKWVQVQHHATASDAILPLKQKGFKVVAANLSASAKDYREVDYTQPTAILMGAEVKGVGEQAIQFVDEEIVLPMLGMVESYNVSVACALILAQAQDQRERAGYYQQVRLSSDVYKKRFFCWAHPALAEYCDKNGLEYPPTGDDGEVIDLANWYRKVRDD